MNKEFENIANHCIYMGGFLSTSSALYDKYEICKVVMSKYYMGLALPEDYEKIYEFNKLLKEFSWAG